MTPSSHKRLVGWVEQFAKLTKPDEVVWCDGSSAEHDRLCELLVRSGTFRSLADDKRPNSFWAGSDPRDVARVENRTYVCAANEIDAGPNNNWVEPDEMRSRLNGLFSGAMSGRTMYVIPFSMGPLDSPHRKIGIELTDSPYVVVSMGIMAKMGSAVLDALGTDGEFVACHHSVGVPLAPGETDSSWPCNPENLYIAHFPESREIWSFGSGYGGNALLGKKCLALRIASVVARDEGWLAEHMLVLKLTNPSGESRYVAGAFPSGCGKTNLAMLVPTLPGWKVETVGDDICWMRIGADGMLRAINPELGFFGVAPGTNSRTNPNAMETLRENAIFTNTALTFEGDIWWEGLTPEVPAQLTSWRGTTWDPNSGEPAAHPNARFTVPAQQDPAIAPEWQDPEGVPISAILFGGRRGSVVPLVHEAFDWSHGVFLGSIVASETTAAASGAVGKLRRDPFAMLPFCGYNMADYFAHWLSFRKRTNPERLPKVFYVNWFRQDENGHYLWPGFGDNSRVLAWIFSRCEGVGEATRTPIGWVPSPDALDLDELKLTAEETAELLRVDLDEWRNEVTLIKAHQESFGERFPEALSQELEALRARLEKT